MKHGGSANQWQVGTTATTEGGISTGNIVYPGGSYGPRLLKWGFNKVSISDGEYIKGDIAVIEGYPGGKTCNSGLPCGHIQMYNGTQWVSDFFQTRPFWPGQKYEDNSPSYLIFRWGDINP